MNNPLLQEVKAIAPWMEDIFQRLHRCPELVLESYIRGHYVGNILELLEPAHSIYPYVIENGEPLRLVNLEEQTCLHQK